MRINKYMKTLAIFRISIPKSVDGYLQVNGRHASLIWGFYALKKKSVKISEERY